MVAWKTESELVASRPPRSVRLRPVVELWWSTWLLAGIAMSCAMFARWEWAGFWWIFLFGLWALVLVSLEGHRRWSRLLVSKGHATTGVIIDVTEVERAGEQPYTVYVYTVAYDLPDGRTLTMTEERSTNELRKGQQLTVLYLLGRPTEAIIYERAHHRTVNDF